MSARPPAVTSANAPGLRALVIDESNLSRSVMATLLRDMGYAVTQAARPQEAMRVILGAAFPFDVILCEYHFMPRSGHVVTGQEWLDELRQNRVLPLATAVIMVTGEARYQCVADSVENALDDYLLKPFTAGDLQNRMGVIRRRKLALAPIYSACEGGDFDRAAKVAENLFREGGPHRLAAARLGSEICLRLGNHDAAMRLLNAVLEAKAVPWARLGLAQVDLATNSTKKASRALEALICDEPNYSDAYDLMGRAQVEELQFTKALATYARAVELTPGNVSRLQKVGNLQLLMGETELAYKHLDSAMVLGANSPTLDFQSLFQLSLAGFDLRKPRCWERPSRLFADALRKHPGSFRLQRLNDMLSVLEHLERRSHSQAVELLKRLMCDVREPQFDFEMGCNVVQLLARMGKCDVKLADASDIVRIIGERFSVSRPALELLVMSSRTCPEFESDLRAAFEHTNDMARKAMWHSLQGQAVQTVRALLTAMEDTRNARFLSLARASLEKNRATFSETELAEALRDIELMQVTYCGYGTHANAGIRLRPTVRNAPPAQVAPAQPATA